MRGWARSRPASRNLRSAVSLGSFHSQARTRPESASSVVDFEAERLADLARGGAAAVGDDVGGHGRAELAVALVDVLDDALALVAAGQVDIDVGPLAALFGEEALEEQVHADRIDGGDAERVADGAVGGRAAPLRQDAVFAAEAHDVPDDEEVAGQMQLFDQRQLALDLAARASRDRAGSGCARPRRCACAGRTSWSRPAERGSAGTRSRGRRG